MKRIKLLKVLIAVFVLLVICNINANATQATDSDIFIDITVNGQYIKTDANAFLQGGTTYVPIRFVSEALCADSVDWNPDTNTATITCGNTVIQLVSGEKTAYIDGLGITVNGGVQIVQDRIFVPVRFISEALDANVCWDGTYYIVNITKDIAVPDSITEDKYTLNDIYLLAEIIEAESGGEPLSGKVAVGNVILNRVKSKLFPDTIYDVIFDRQYGTQFEPVINGTIYNTPSSDSVIAAKQALNGVNPAGESLFFLNPQIAQSLWITTHRTFYTTIANHDFYV